jgi:hypothetical protein
MSHPHASRAGRRTGRTAYLIGAVLVVIALVLCGGGGIVFAAPATRTGQGVERAVIGMAIFDMHEGDDYWLYQPAGPSWPDQVECRFGAPHDEDFVLRRTERPFGAPETMTESGGEYAFYGTLRGDRNENVLIECPSDLYLVVPSREPLWYLLAALAGGAVTGLAGLLVVVVAAVRHRPGAAPRTAAAGAAPGPGPAPGGPAAGPVGPVPGGAPRTRAPTRPSPLWYLAVLPLTVMSVIACMAGLLGGLGAGFLDSFDPPVVGEPRSGTVYDAYRHNDGYLLYADVAEAPPTEPVTCLITDDTGAVEPLEVGTDRPFAVPETITHEGQTFRFFATFRLRDPILGTVTCDGESTLLVRPSNRPQVWVAAFVAVAFAALTVAAVFGIVLSARRRR